MSKPAAAASNGGCASSMTVAKRQCTQAVFKECNASGCFVQVFVHGMAFSNRTHPWQFIDAEHFNVRISRELKMGMNVVPSRGKDAVKHVTVFPYGPAEMKCTSREGCGGIVENGQALQWACNELLHYECGPVSADVMIMYIDVKQHTDFLLVENIVRAMFHVEVTSDPDAPEPKKPCWLRGSIVENHRDSWKHHADANAQKFFKLNAMHTEMTLSLQVQMAALEQQLQAEKADWVSQLQVERASVQAERQTYHDALAEIKKIASCSVCHDVVPEVGACMLAPCGHYTCVPCFNDYFETIGGDPQLCCVCKKPADEETWRPLWAMTGIGAVIKKTRIAHA